MTTFDWTGGDIQMTHTHTRTETHEERFGRLIREALEVGKQCAPSRAHSLAMTSVEQGGLWARVDRDEKSQTEADAVRHGGPPPLST